MSELGSSSQITGLTVVTACYFLQVFVKELTLNHTSVVQLAPTNSSRLSHWFGGHHGGYYEVYVTTLESGALPSPTVTYRAPAIPAPHQLQVLPEKNGSYILYWKSQELPQQVKQAK